MTAALFDADEVRKAIALLVEPKQVFEIRALDARLNDNKWKIGIVSGYFDNADKAVEALSNIGKAKSIYITLNPVIPDLLARRCNRLDYAGKDELTGDQHITRRRWLLIDTDPERPAGISATEDELKAALARANEVEKFLTEIGFPQPVRAGSGNGGHLLYRIDLPVDDGGLIKNVLTVLATKFDDAIVGVDQTVFNSSRITKLYGTLACKGDNVPERPHRFSKVCSVPDPLEVVSKDLLEKVAALQPPATMASTVTTPLATTKTFTSRRNGGFDVRGFLSQHGVAVKSETVKGAMTVIALEQCPFDTDHGGHGEVAVFENADGRLGFKCHHAGCAGRGWREFRQHLDPDAYNRKRETRPTMNVKPPTNVEELRAAIVGILSTRLPITEKHEEVADVVVDFLRGRGTFYFHQLHRDFATAMFFDSGSKRLLRVQADEFLSDIAELTGINMGNPAFKYIAAAVEVAALHGTGIIPETYWASRPTAIYLSNGDGSMARITGCFEHGNVEILDNGTDGVLFPVGATLPVWELVEPVDPFESCQLFKGVNVSGEHGKTILKLWLLSLPTKPICKPPLVATGEVGSGKTRTIRGMAELYGLPFMSTTPKAGEKSQNDFWVSLDAGGLFTLDNADTRIDWLADAVATASTGAGDHRRQLYTDKGTQEFKPNAWLALTAANPTFAQDAALADRLLVVRMNRRTDKTEDKALSAEIVHNRNAALSWIARTLATALADTVGTPRGLNKRHPDFAEFAIKLGRAMNCESEVIAALTAAEEDKSRFNLENDALGLGVIKLMSAEPAGFVGTSAELLTRLATIEPDEFGEDAKGARGNRLWTTKRLGKRLAGIWVHIEALFDAKRDRDNAGHAAVFSIKPKNAVLRFQTPEMGKLPNEISRGDFPVSAPSNRNTAEMAPQTHDGWQNLGTMTTSICPPTEEQAVATAAHFKDDPTYGGLFDD